MSYDLTNDRPLFLQIADILKADIANGMYREGDRIPSTTDLSVAYTINPATALKGVNLLVEEGLVFKRRGQGMFVASGARGKLLEERRRAFIDNYVKPMLAEANDLGLTSEELLEMISGRIDDGDRA